MEENCGWAQIVSLTDIETPPVVLTADKLTIGRASDCDVCFSGNKLVSAHHCSIFRDQEGRVWLSDNSTNGTLLNMMYKITKGDRKQLGHGDEFYIVFKKNNEELNVGYIFQDLAKLQEEESTQEYSPVTGLEATLADDEINEVEHSPEPRKRKLDDSLAEESQSKKSRPSPSDQSSSAKEEPVSVSDTGETKVENKETKTEVHESKPDNATDSGVKDAGAEVKDAESEVKDTSSRKDKSTVEVKEEKQSQAPKKDDIEENLLCIICQEIMHDCISLQPCLHSFCAGCYSDWMARSKECPSCRKQVERINKNHIVNNLIEAYLREHPDKKRPEEDLKALDARNKVTTDMLYPKTKPKKTYENLEDYTDSSDYVSDSDEESPDMPAHPPAFGTPGYIPPAPPLGGALFGFGTPFFGVVRPPRVICRQCPDYKDPKDNTQNTGEITTAANTAETEGGEPGPSATGNAADETPGTSGTGGNTGTGLGYKDDPKLMPDPIPFVCIQNQNHVLCQCCLQPMPDRRAQNNDPSRPGYRPQQCSICFRAFCHAYWGCRKQDCLGCLDKFKEMNFGRKCLNNLILDNVSESAIFKDYIDQKKMSVKDVLHECVRKMEAGEFTCPDQARITFNSNAGVCYGCGLRNFKALALQYRKAIPKHELPEYARNRPDCYWGSNCRTQRNKPQHAANFNHICDQTRF